MKDARKFTKTVVFRWEEPEKGTATETWKLTAAEWQIIDNAIVWIRNYWENIGDAYGGAIARTLVYSGKTNGAGYDVNHFKDALQNLADNSRYTTGEDLYDTDCPVFAANGIKR